MRGLSNLRGFFEIRGAFKYEGLLDLLGFANLEYGTMAVRRIYKGAGRYIHNFWKLVGATRTYDGNREGGMP